MSYQRLYKPALRRHGRNEVQPKLTIDAEFEAARRVACDLVARRWPELAQVTPGVGSRHRREPDARVLQALHLSDVPSRQPASREFTFTFVGEPGSAAEPAAPQVARVTVDSQQRVLKALVSK